MSGRKLRWLGLGMAATAGAGVLGLTAIMNSAFAYGAVEPDVFHCGGCLVPETTEVMGGSGLPIPPTSYVDAVNNLYIQPNLPGTSPSALFTPEGLYPLTGVNDLPLDESVSRGLTILNDTIAPGLAAGTPEGVFGYSQSAIISSLEMEQLEQEGLGGSPASFVLIGDIMNPNGGIFERFDGLQLPSLGLDFSGGTPADDFPTTIYTLEYDGFADFPRYPINLLSDLNAVAGIEFVHGTYPDLTLQQVTPVSEGGQAILLPGSELLGTPDSLTNYYMIPTTDLPLLDLVRDIPLIGNPIADLLQPDLTPLVNLGYGDPDFGYSTSPANVATPFGLFPSLSDFEKLPGLLVSGTQTGITNFIGDFTGSGPNPVSLDPLTSLDSLTSLLGGSSGSSILTDPLAALSAAASDPTALLSSPTDIINNISSAASTAYSTLLPTADILNAILTSIPAYDATLFVDNLSNPLDAVGLPIAADTGLFTVAGGVEGLVLLNAASTIAADFGLGALTSLIPF